MPLLAFLIVLAHFFAAACAVSAGEFRAGAAQVDITPGQGTPMAGYYAFRAVSGVLDPIFAKAIVVEQDDALAAFIVIDLSGTSRPLVEAARQLIAEQCGIPGERVMISATHTHTGPQLPRGSMMDDITKVNLPEGRRYVSALPGLIARAVSEARARLAPARASSAIGKAEGISFNRRVLREGSPLAIWQPQKIDPATERPAGPVDPDVGLLVFDPVAAGAPPLAAYVNFAMHPTSVGGGTRISADYPGELARLLRERKGAEMIAVFANGCCGNINQTDYLTGTRRNHLQLGAALADATLAAWPDLKPLRTHAPRVRSAMVRLERRTFTDAEIAKAKDIAARMFTEKLGTVPMAEAVCILESVAKKQVPLEVEVQVISFSDDLAVVSLPGEIFVELGLAIKKASPFRHTLIAELANGSMGYVPNREAYPQGHYEVVSARAVAGSGERLAEEALRLLKEVAGR
jgi:hypothetical protein